MLRIFKKINIFEKLHRLQKSKKLQRLQLLQRFEKLQKSKRFVNKELVNLEKSGQKKATQSGWRNKYSLETTLKIRGRKSQRATLTHLTSSTKFTLLCIAP